MANNKKKNVIEVWEEDGKAGTFAYVEKLGECEMIWAIFEGLTELKRQEKRTQYIASKGVGYDR